MDINIEKGHKDDRPTEKRRDLDKKENPPAKRGGFHARHQDVTTSLVTHPIDIWVATYRSLCRAASIRVVPVGKAKTRYVTVPADVAGDDRFPFEDGEEVTVRIEEDKHRVVVEKVE